jgi:sugar phosphate isomerase/epimerase
MEHLGRRTFLGTIAAAALHGGALEPQGKFPTEARARLGVATYPFRKQIGPNMKLGEFAHTIPGTFGISGIEPWSHHFESTDADYIQSLRTDFDKAQVHVLNIPVDIHANLCGSESERTKALEEYHKWVDAAVVLGSPSIRVHLPKTANGDTECAVSGLRTVAQYAGTRNIVVNIENDDPGSEQPERVVRVIKAAKTPFLRALPDFANSMILHNDRNYNEQALSMLFPLAYNISHVKNMLQDGDKVYRVDVDPIFSIAKGARYRGYFSMEWDAEGDPYQGTKTLIAASLRNLG